MDFTEGSSLYKSFNKKERRAFMIGASCLIPLLDLTLDATFDLEKQHPPPQAGDKRAIFEANRLSRRALATSSSSYMGRSTRDRDATSTHATSSTNPTSEASEENEVPPKIKALAWMCALRNYHMPKDSESRSSSSSSSASSTTSRTSSESIESFFMDHHLLVIQDEVAKIKMNVRMGDKMRREFDKHLAVLQKGGQERTGWDYVKHAIQEVHTIEFSPSEEEEEEDKEEDEDEDDDDDQLDPTVYKNGRLRGEDEEDEAQYSDDQNSSSNSSDSLSPTSLVHPTPSLSAEPLRPKRLFAPLLSPSLATTHLNATANSSPSSSSSSSTDEPISNHPPAKRIRLGGSAVDDGKKVPHWIRVPAGFDKLLEVKEDDGGDETMFEIQGLEEDQVEGKIPDKGKRGALRLKGKGKGRQKKG